MNKLIITRWNGRVLTALGSGKEIVELSLEEETSILGNIYIGRISRIGMRWNRIIQLRPDTSLLLKYNHKFPLPILLPKIPSFCIPRYQQAAPPCL